METPYIGQKVRALDGRLREIKEDRIGEIIGFNEGIHCVIVRFKNDFILSFTTDGKEYSWDTDIDIEFLVDEEFLQENKDSLLIEIL